MPTDSQHPAANRGKIPATVITGFLGSGKTSLVEHLLRNPNGKRIALIVNEFGDRGVDGELIKGCGIEACNDEDVVELANGCICCTVADDFVPTMRKLIERDNPPDHILIETSGLALPKPLIKAFNWPDVRNRVTVDGVVAVVDAAAAAAGLFAHDPAAVQAQREADASLDHESPLEELFEEQLGSADMVLLNKLDLVDEAGRSRAEAAAAEHLRPGVGTVGCSYGRIDPAVLLGLGVGAEDDLDSRPSHHDGEDEHDHDDFETSVVLMEARASVQEVEDEVRRLAREAKALRVKGFVEVAGKPMRLAVQAVGDRVSTYFDRPVLGASGVGRLVVIRLKQAA